jgi:molybdenum cofactor cytidylyltransferase
MRQSEHIDAIVLASARRRRFERTPASRDAELGAAIRALAASPVGRIVVVLPDGAEGLVADVDLHGADPVVCERDGGQAVQLACGLAELDGADAVVVVLADGCLSTPDAVRRVIAARDGTPVVRACYGGRPGHPVLLERPLIAALRDTTGDCSARNLIVSAVPRDVPCDDLVGDEGVPFWPELEVVGAGGPML